MESKIKQLCKDIKNESLIESNYTIKTLLDKFSSTSSTDTKLNIIMAVLLAVTDEDYFRYDINNLSR